MFKPCCVKSSILWLFLNDYNRKLKSQRTTILLGQQLYTFALFPKVIYFWFSFFKSHESLFRIKLEVKSEMFGCIFLFKTVSFCDFWLFFKSFLTKKQVQISYPRRFFPWPDQKYRSPFSYTRGNFQVHFGSIGATLFKSPSQYNRRGQGYGYFRFPIEAFSFIWNRNVTAHRQSPSLLYSPCREDNPWKKNGGLGRV